jgi:type IX secretion system PorP/SprF family membrane protein
MSKLKTHVLLTFLFLFYLISNHTYSQDLQNFTQFYFNPSLINASLVGVEGRPAMFVSYRKQWLGLTGSPTIANFSIQAPLVNRVNIGLSLTSNKQGVINTSSALFAGGYTLPISENQSFRFGFSAGVASNVIDFEALDPAFRNSGDPLLGNLVQSSLQTIGSVGASYNGQTFHAGLSIPNLFQPSYLTTTSFGVPQFKPLESILIHASNRFYFNNNQNIFEPYLIYRFNNSLPSQIEVAALVHLKNLVHFGASYKANFGLSALGGFRLNKEMAVGFSYTIQNIGENQLPNPTFEIHLGYLFGKRNKKIPIYSFVNTELEKKPRKTALELANEKRKVKAELAKTPEQYKPSSAAPSPRYQRTEMEVSSETDDKKTVVVAKGTPEKKPVETKKPGPAGKKAAPAAAQKSTPPQKPSEQKKTDGLGENPTLEEVVAHRQNQLIKGVPKSVAKDLKIVPTTRIVLDSVSQHKEEQDRLKRLEAHAADPDMEHKDEKGIHPHEERHEFAKRGTHNSEMNLGDYVIAGVFNSEANAKKYSDGLRKLGFLDADYGFLSAHNHWYVHISESNDITIARADRDKFRKMAIFKESWLLTVHP